jgi:peroxiredoxin
MQMQSQFMRDLLPHLHEDLSAQVPASVPGEGWFVPIGQRLLPAPPQPFPSRVVDIPGSSRSPETVRVGEKAPPFTLRTTPEQSVSLDDFLGNPIVLAFYPADWSPVCSDQMVLYNEVLPQFAEHSAVILGISVDNVWCHQAFSKDRRLSFPLLADFEPKGTVARSYGVYREQDGICERALFLIDPEGAVRWTHVSPLGVNPGAAGILRALESLRTAMEAAA